MAEVEQDHVLFSVNESPLPQSWILQVCRGIVHMDGGVVWMASTVKSTKHLGRHYANSIPTLSENRQ